MTLHPVSVGLKFGFLTVLYVFLVWVALSALRDLRGSPRRRGPRSADSGDIADSAPGPFEATGLYDALAGARHSEEDFEPRLLVERAEGHPSGVAYDLSEEVTLGRGDVEIQLEDPFASSRHARIWPEGAVLVIEDLGSTNGTYLNETALSGPQPLHDGDRIRIGDSEFSYLQ